MQPYNEILPCETNCSGKGIGFFERYLSIWVILCMIAGVSLGQFFPVVPDVLSTMEYANVSIPIALLIWLMIYPMMLKVDFGSIVHSFTKPKGLTVTLITNWLIKPFTMYFFAYLFFKVLFTNFISADLATEYLAGAVLLGAAPCTAMVFVWSHLTKGNAAYTLVQVAINDLIILIAFVPIVALLLGISDVVVPYDTLFLSVLLFVLMPFSAGYLSRTYVIRQKGIEFFENRFLPSFRHITILGLLLTLILLFSFQGQTLIENPMHILLIGVPLIIQTYFIFFIAYIWAKSWRVPHDVSAPAALIGASNFFELAVAVAISLFGLGSGAALVTVVGVLVEVPVMLSLVWVANRTVNWRCR